MRTSKKTGDQSQGSPACYHLLCKVTAAPGNRERGCTQTSTAAAGGLGGCMCMSIPAKRKKNKGGERSGLILGISPGKQTLGLDPAPSETKHKPHWLQEAPGQVTRMFQAFPKLQLSLGDCMYQRKHLQKLLEENGSRGKGFPSLNWAVVGEQGDGNMAKERQKYYIQCAILFLRWRAAEMLSAGSGREKVVYSKCLQFPGFCPQIQQKSGIKLPFISKEWNQTPNICCTGLLWPLPFLLPWAWKDFSHAAFNVHLLFISSSAPEIIFGGAETLCPV